MLIPNPINQIGQNSIYIRFITLQGTTTWTSRCSTKFRFNSLTVIKVFDCHRSHAIQLLMWYNYVCSHACLGFNSILLYIRHVLESPWNLWTTHICFFLAIFHAILCCHQPFLRKIIDTCIEYCIDQTNIEINRRSC